MKFTKIGYLILLTFCGGTLLAQTVQFNGSPKSAISSGAIIPEGKKMFWTSGTTGGVADSTAQEGTRA